MTTPERGIEEIVEEIWRAGNNVVRTEIDRKYAIRKILENLLHQELQKARESWLQEEIVTLKEEKLEAELHYDMRGMAETKTYCSALQTIIDRYQSELDQPLTNQETNK